MSTVASIIEPGSAFLHVSNRGQTGNRIWVAPFVKDSIHSVTNDVNSEHPTLRDVLKTRPKTACVMENSTMDNIVKSKHEILVNILNVMETRRLRKSAFSSRTSPSQAWTSNGEFDHDAEALNSLYKIYLQKSLNTDNNAKQPSIVRLQKYDEDPTSSNCCDCKCQKDHRYEKMSSAKLKQSSPVSYLRIDQQMDKYQRPKTAGGLTSKFKALPMTKVEFVREEHIKEVAEKRRKCKQKSALFLRRNCEHRDDNEVLWTKFGLLPVKSTGGLEDSLVLEDLEYQLTGAFRRGDDGNESTGGTDQSARTDDPYTFARHRNQSQQPGNQYRNSSRTQSRSITPHIMIQRSDSSRYRYSKQQNNSVNDEKDVKRSSSQNAVSPEKDEILYQSSALKERLLEPRYSDGSSCARENEILSQECDGETDFLSDENGEIYSILNQDEHSFDTVLSSKKRDCSAKSAIASHRQIPRSNEDNITSLPGRNETMGQAWKPGNETASTMQTTRQPIGEDDLFKKKNGGTTGIPLDEKPRMMSSRESPFLKKKNNTYLSPDEDDLQTFVKLNLNDSISHRSTPPLNDMLQNRLKKGENGASSGGQPVRRAKSAILISKTLKDRERSTPISNKKISVKSNKSQLSNNREQSHHTSRKQPRSARSTRSSGRTKKLTVEEKERKKERNADIVKLKQLEQAEEKRKENKKKIEEEQRKIEEHKIELESTQADLARQEEEMKKALNEKRSRLAQERKQKRKEEAEKRRQEVEKQREEKRIAELDMSRKNAELALLAREEKEKAHALKAELKRLEEEERLRQLEEDRLERQRQLEREEEEKIELERIKESERIEVQRNEEERRKREEVIMAAELKLRLLEEEQQRQKEKQRMEQQRIKEEKQCLLRRENERIIQEKLCEMEKLRNAEEKTRLALQKAEQKRLVLLNRKRENLDKRTELAFTKHNQRTTKSNEFSYFVQIPREVWELPIGWHKKPRYKSGGVRKK